MQPPWAIRWSGLREVRVDLRVVVGKASRQECPSWSLLTGNVIRGRIHPCGEGRHVAGEEAPAGFFVGGLHMAKVQKTTDSSSLAEVVDRILDKGIVIDAFAKVSLVGIELVSIEARVVVASVETYLKYAEAIGLTATAAQPA